MPVCKFYGGNFAVASPLEVMGRNYNIQELTIIYWTPGGI
jgi:hypothetical protein